MHCRHKGKACFSQRTRFSKKRQQGITRPIAIKRFDIFISEVVIEEARQGDPTAAQKRLDVLNSFPNLELNKKVEDIAKIYMKRLDIPQKAIRDAAHLSVASVHNIDYFVTWNCNHIANGENIKKLIQVNKEISVHTPIICTPEELKKEDN